MQHALSTTFYGVFPIGISIGLEKNACTQRRVILIDLLSLPQEVHRGASGKQRSIVKVMLLRNIVCSQKKLFNYLFAGFELQEIFLARVE